MLSPLIAVCTTALFFADPPSLPYLSTEPIDQLFEPNSAPYKIILASDFTDQNQDEIWKVWSHPKVINYFNKHPQLTVVYLDKESHEDPYLEACSPHHLPTIMLWPQTNSSEVQRRPETLETPDELINWLKFVQVNRSPSDELYRQVALYPDQMETRLDLIDELNDADNNFEADILYPWLLLNSQSWLGAINESSPSDSPPITENRFRSIVLEHIKRLRNTHHLFVNERERKLSIQNRQLDLENWIDQYQWRSTIFRSGPVGSQERFQQILVPFIEELEEKANTSLATDRDLLILEALIAEPPAWDELLKDHGIHTNP